jgi:hypothetical protein
MFIGKARSRGDFRNSWSSYGARSAEDLVSGCVLFHFPTCSEVRLHIFLSGQPLLIAKLIRWRCAT